MSAAAPRPGVRARRAIVAFAEEVFAVVDRVHDEALRAHAASVARGAPLGGGDIAELSPAIRSNLRAGRGLVIGIGLIVAPDVLHDEPLRLEWWQTEPGREDPVALEVDLNRLSLGFYDYESAEWFDVPRRSGARHVVGPYVDVHGTGQYILTFTTPLVADGQFLGVAGADVPAAWLETRLLPELGGAREVVVLGAEGRVVLSTSTAWLTGELVSAEAADALGFQSLPRLPWRLRTGKFSKPLTSQV
jgi:hypothetical protein